jgi:catechol 2,3-dioxygenase-like lactoylglutathione lyase family enzyme
MIALAAIDHVVFRVRDMAAMTAFYEAVLGARVERRVEDLGLVQLRAGNALIDFVACDGELGREGGAPPGREGHNIDHVCFQVSPWDEAAILAHLAEHGQDEFEVARRYGAEGFGPSIYLTDPEGNRIELKGPPDSTDGATSYG